MILGFVGSYDLECSVLLLDCNPIISWFSRRFINCPSGLAKVSIVEFLVGLRRVLIVL